MRRVWFFAGFAALAVACARSTPGETPPGDSSSASSGPLGKSVALARAAAETGALDFARTVGTQSSTWVEAVRLHRWAEAAKLIDAMPAEERGRPGVRYARARVASHLGDHARVAKELAGLDKLLPVLQSEVIEARASAELEVGPFDSAATYFGARTDATSLVKSALAFERANQPDRARQALERALLAARREKKDSVRIPLEARARAIRARLAEKRGDKALATADLRWIATLAPATQEAEDADVRLETLAPDRKLTAKERFDRAWALAGEGKIERTERELGLIESLAGPGPSKADVLRARGWALYVARKDYGKAADLLEQAVKLGSKEPARDLFYAARARSRSHADDRAIKLYGDLARRHPNTYWAEQAHYLSARLHYIAGRWNEASAAYEGYLKRYRKKGQHTNSARHEQAVAWLGGGHHARAQKALDALAKATKREQDAALYQELSGLALEKSGDQKGAKQAYRAVIREAPLSFAALAASSRLASLGEPRPTPIDAPGSKPIAKPLEVKLPPKVTLLMQLGLDADAEAALALHEESIKKQHAPRSEEALCHAYSALSSAARRYKAGQRAARWSLLTEAPSPSTRWLWECIYPRPYEPLVRDAEREHKLPENLVYAVMRQESAFAPAVVSPANAVGLLQLIPPTARNVCQELGVSYDPLLLESPPHNIRLGAYYLKKVLGTFGGNVALGAAAYNAGPSAVSRWLESGEKLPLDVFVARIPYRETRTYVSRASPIGRHAPTSRVCSETWLVTRTWRAARKPFRRWSSRSRRVCAHRQTPTDPRTDPALRMKSPQTGKRAAGPL